MDRIEHFQWCQDKKALERVTVEITKEDAINYFKRIRANIDRAIRFIELGAPSVLVANESRMIQRRALCGQAEYEEFKEMKNVQPTQEK